ncbi:4-carboxy-4-hydroxy-2-oxoadipate aldolase/oxaloacetate decarboxylase [Modicisalibacter luteus]|jgi:4-hydroxy-4-methyl-2-oxoglutarate aldolase|uniref:4-carboxy-4-hydroxy-2-oxoadipate aldolase/oxaloacetate decarboxylase n=1 Tax=Modicisalibacter luteus TaxID=453962 RepID=A0ABV7M5S5_9GAMM|nr:4-carboxy-4-hydroxy-2-oxoadipate aldolase/oxaloacetate decarboxylase [Halomonas lutea]GHA88226.1 S-adenosylmethionine--2-demethylmenaquinone methyltransferase [Halomonas lutea]
MPTQEQLATLKSFGTATIHEAQGQVGAMSSCIKPLEPARRLIGRALTVDCYPADNLMIHYAITQAQPGDVLVIDAKGFTEGGPWGDILTLAAQKAGIHGLVIDGMVRDAETIIEFGFPVFSKGLSIKATNKAQPGRVNVPVICGGVAVKPGDIVVGDRDGVVVVDPERISEVIDASRAREDKEESIRQQLEQGKTTVELLNLAPVLQRLGVR